MPANSLGETGGPVDPFKLHDRDAVLPLSLHGLAHAMPMLQINRSAVGPHASLWEARDLVRKRLGLAPSGVAGKRRASRLRRSVCCNQPKGKVSGLRYLPVRRNWAALSYCPQRRLNPYSLVGATIGSNSAYSWQPAVDAAISTACLPPNATGRPGATPSDPWDKLPECSGSVHHLRG